LTSYFDQTVYRENPLIPVVNMEFRSYLKSNVTQYKMGRISYNKVNLYDSWLSDMLPPVEMSYVDFEMKDYLLQEYNPGNALLYGYFFLDDV
jgi:hypothetical protein